jgi:hypothetical protein
MVKHGFLDPHCRSIEEIMHASYENLLKRENRP